jgi:hypothetical protein
MVCQACGAQVAAGDVRFCPNCGAQMAAPPPPVYAQYPPPMSMPMAPPRVQRNLQTLAMLWCIYGVYRFAAGLMGMFFVRAFAWGRFGDWPFGRYGGPWGPHFMGGLLPVIATVTVLAAAFALITAYGLMTRKPWGRVLAIIAAILVLIKFPIGTALGIYTLWVLAPAASGAEYEAIADHS